MSKLYCIVVEDEPLAAKVMVDYIGHVPFLQLQGTFKDAILAMEYLRDHKVDLIFLDIHLPKLKGMDFLRTLEKAPAVIITTAYHRYALQGYDLNVTDYLLKPIEFKRFLVAVNKVKRVVGSKQNPRDQLEKDFIFLRVKRKMVKISYSDMLYIESQREYLKVVTSEQSYTTKMSIHKMESTLPSDLFVRIHRSFIISVSKIRSYSPNEVEVNGTSIPIGRNYKEVIPNLYS